MFLVEKLDLMDTTTQMLGLAPLPKFSLGLWQQESRSSHKFASPWASSGLKAL
jgi:hypothetical protein